LFFALSRLYYCLIFFNNHQAPGPSKSC